MTAPNAPADAPRFRILMIDDDPDVTCVLRASMEPKFEVAEAENGLVGLQILETFQPDLIICDIMMPLLNGLKVIEAVRQHPVFGATPVFFLTGEDRPALPQVTKQLGGNLFLAKPIEPWLLIELIEMFIDETKMTPRPREAIGAPAAEPETAAAARAVEAPIAAPAEPVAEKTAEPAAAAESGALEFASGQDPHGPVRILVIDCDSRNIGELKELLMRDSDGKWETLWSTEPLAALGRLRRMEPDLILYNPRQKVMDGFALGRFLNQRRLGGRYEIAFVGRGMSPEEAAYSRSELKREPIDLDLMPTEILAQLEEAIEVARTKMRPKTSTVSDLTTRRAAAPSAPVSEDQIRRIQEMIDKKSA